MKAFVKTRNGNFPDVNYYVAWKGLTEIGYDVVKFEEKEQDTIEVSAHTPLFGGVGACRKIIKRVFGWDYIGINPYPTELMPFMHRGVRRGKWGELREEALEGHKFIKPVIQKQFTGAVLNTILDTIRTGKVEEDHEIYLCDMVDFLSEYRVYVHEHEIVGVKNYFNKEEDGYELVPKRTDLLEMIAAYKPSAPVAYSLDVGMIVNPDGSGKHIPALVEINDGICLGNYGLDSIHYAEMLSSRWIEIATNESVEIVT